MAVPKIRLEVISPVATEGGADGTIRIVADSIVEGVPYNANFTASGASSGVDYTSIGTSKEFDESLQQDLTIEALGTSADESDKWVTVTLEPSDDYEIVSPHVAAVKLEYLKDTITVQLNAASIGEEATGSAPFVGARRLTAGVTYPFYLVLSKAATGACSVDVDVSTDDTGGNDDADFGVDYDIHNCPGTAASIPVTINFVEGDTSKLLFLEVLEGAESPEKNMVLHIQTPVGLTLGTTTSQTFRLYENLP